MSSSYFFLLSNIAILPAWLLLALAPRWNGTRVVAAYVVPSLFAVAWAAIMLVRFVPNGGGFATLDQLAALLEDNWLLVAGWLHAIVFDLFVGAWEVRDAQRLGINHGLVVPCLVLTFLAGPVGLLAYFAVRIYKVRRVPGA